MATGDLKNNIQKMLTLLKRVKYPTELELEGISAGGSSTYLKIYHYLFTSYSHHIADLIANHGVELYAKTDSKFIIEVYKVLRDLFAYKPPITKDQFFSTHFIERKVIMTTEIIDLFYKKHLSMAPHKLTTFHTSSATSDHKLGGSKGLLWQPKTKLVTRADENLAVGFPRKVAFSASHRQDCSPEAPPQSNQRADHDGDCPRIVNVGPSLHRAEYDEDDQLTNRHIDIVAMSPATNKTIHHDTLDYVKEDVQTNSGAIKHINKTLVEIARRMDWLEANVSPQVAPDNEDIEQQLGKILKTMENLTARMVLLEHRVILVESKIVSIPVLESICAVPTNSVQQNGQKFPDSHTDDDDDAHGSLTTKPSLRRISDSPSSLFSPAPSTPVTAVPCCYPPGNETTTGQFEPISPRHGDVSANHQALADTSLSPCVLSAPRIVSNVFTNTELTPSKTSGTSHPGSGFMIFNTTDPDSVVIAPSLTIVHKSNERTVTGDQNGIPDEIDSVTDSVLNRVSVRNQRIENMFMETRELCKRTTSLSDDE